MPLRIAACRLEYPLPLSKFAEVGASSHVCWQTIAGFAHLPSHLEKQRKNVADGFKWMLKAAATGNPLAQMQVASCYEAGVGVREDVKQVMNLQTG